MLLCDRGGCEAQHVTAPPRDSPKRIVISCKLAKLRNGRAAQFIRVLIAEMFERHLDCVLVSLEPRQKQHQNLGCTCACRRAFTRVNLIPEMPDSGVGVASLQRLEINGMITVEVLERRLAMAVKFNISPPRLAFSRRES